MSKQYNNLDINNIKILYILEFIFFLPLFYISIHYILIIYENFDVILKLFDKISNSEKFYPNNNKTKFPFVTYSINENSSWWNTIFNKNFYSKELIDSQNNEWLNLEKNKGQIWKTSKLRIESQNYDKNCTSITNINDIKKDLDIKNISITPANWHITGYKFRCIKYEMIYKIPMYSDQNFQKFLLFIKSNSTKLYSFNAKFNLNEMFVNTKSYNFKHSILNKEFLIEQYKNLDSNIIESKLKDWKTWFKLCVLDTIINNKDLLLLTIKRSEYSLVLIQDFVHDMNKIFPNNLQELLINHTNYFQYTRLANYLAYFIQLINNSQISYDEEFSKYLENLTKNLNRDYKNNFIDLNEKYMCLSRESVSTYNGFVSEYVDLGYNLLKLPQDPENSKEIKEFNITLKEFTTKVKDHLLIDSKDTINFRENKKNIKYILKEIELREYLINDKYLHDKLVLDLESKPRINSINQKWGSINKILIKK